MKYLPKKLLTLSYLIICSFLFCLSIHASDSTYGNFTTATFLCETPLCSYQTQAIEVNGVRYFTLPSLANALNHTSSPFNFKWLPKQQVIEIQKDTAYSGASLERISTGDKPFKVQPNQVTLLVGGSSYTLNTFLYNNQNYFNPTDLTPLLHCDFAINPNTYIIKVYPDLPYRQVLTSDGSSPMFKTSTDTRLTISPQRWASTLRNSAFVDHSNRLNTLNVSDALYITTYDATLKPIETKELPLELPSWGGFYSGSNYNFCVVGQSNKEQASQKEVIRLIRYDKNFNRLDALSITGSMCSTTVPFDAGSLRMQEIGNKLIIHTSRERYKSSDGLNHQSQLTLIVDIDEMKLVNDLGLFQPNHVSHSFNQFVLKDGSKHVLLDHGDAYPRSIVLHAGDGSQYKEVDLFKIPGKTGANCTGVFVGGFAMSKDHYIAAFSTIDHSLATAYTSYNIVGIEKEQRHIMVSAVPKNNLSNDAVKQKMIMDYTGTTKTASSPYLIKLSDQHLALLWQEKDSSSLHTCIRYVCLDQEGNACTPVQSLYGTLSDCEPVLYNDTLTWFVDFLDSRLMYSLPLKMILPN